jgi:ankyrin repeat protein
MLEVLKLLIQFGANANQRDSDGQTALHYGKIIIWMFYNWLLAACNGYFEVAKFLLNSGIDLNVKCNEGLTALDLATDDNIIDLLKVQL